MAFRRARYTGPGGLLVLLVLFLATPVGPWILGGLCARLAPSYGWQLEIGRTAGWFLGTAAFHQVRAGSRDQGIEVAVERLDLDLLSYAVELVRPAVQLQAASAPVDSVAPGPVEALPLDYFPTLRIAQGRVLYVQPDGLEVLAEDLEAHYEAVEDTLGRLFVSLPRWVVQSQDREWGTGLLRGHLELRPQLLSLSEFHLSGRVDSLDTELQIDGRLALVEGLPLAFTVRSHCRVPEDSLQGQVDLQARGGLQPLALQVEVEGRAEQPGWGEVSLRAHAELEAERIVVESLDLGLLGGRLQGRVTYLPSLDSLAVELEMEEVDLARLPGSATGGLAQGICRAQLNPSARRYSADLEIHLQQLDLLPGGPFDFALSAALRPDQSVRAELRSQLGHLQATGLFDPHSSYELALEGTVEPAQLASRPLQPVQVSGRVKPDTVELRLETAHLPFADDEFGPLVLDLILRQQRFLEVALALEEDQARLRLLLDLEKGEVDSLVSVVAPLALDRLASDLQGSLQGQVQGSSALDVSGAQVSGRFELSGAAYRNWHTGPLQVDLEYGAQRAICRLEGRGFAVDATLDSLKHFAGQARLDQAVFYCISGADTAIDSVARAALSGTLDWSGRLDRPEALEARVALEQLEWDQGAWQLRAAGPVQLHYGQEQAVLEPLSLHTSLGRLEVAGKAHPDSLAVVVEMPALELQQLVAELQGQGRARLEVGGTLNHPILDSRVELQQIALAGRTLGDLLIRLQLSDSLSLEAALDQDRVGDPELVVALSMPAASLLAGESSPPRGDLQLRVAAQQLDLQAPLSYLLADSVRGLVDLEGFFSAPLAVLADSLQWHDFYGGVQFERFEVEKQGLQLALQRGGRIELEDDHLDLSDLGFAIEVYDLEKETFRAGGVLQLAGRVEAARPFLLQLDLQKLDLLVLENLGMGALPEGDFDLQARLSGTRTAPVLEVELDLALEDLGEVEGRFHGSGREGVLELDWSTLIGDEMQVRGRLPWDLEKGEVSWDQGILRAQSEGLSLLLLLDQLPQLGNIDGTLGLDLELRGFDTAMEIQGQIDIADLELALIDVKPGYLFPSGRLEFSGRRGEFRDFVGRPQKGKGRIEISGFMEVEALDQLAYEVRLAATDLPYNYDDIFDVPRIDIDLGMRSTESGSLLAGRVQLDQVQVDLPLIDLNAPPAPPPPAAVQDEFLQGMELDIDVDIRAMHLENELADLDMEGSTRVYGTFYKPLFQGEMLIVEGKVFVLNNEFDFERGRISLDRLVPTYSILDIAYDPLLLNPELDLSAVTTVSPIDSPDETFQITFALEGPVQEVVPRFTSDPPREDTEVLMLVAFGVLSKPSMLFDQENRGALYSTAGQLLLSRQVKKIGLDEFQLLPSGTLLETVGLPSMHLGKYFKVPLPLWVRYEALTKDPSLGEFSVEHKLRSYLTITGMAQSEKERYGVGLGIKKDF